MPNWGTLLIRAYLTVTGRMFPIAQVEKLRHKGRWDSVSRGRCQWTCGKVTCLPSMRTLCRPPPWDQGQHPLAWLGGQPWGVQEGTLLLQTQAHTFHQHLPWCPPWDMTQHPATCARHIPVRTALPSPGWMSLQPETISAANRDHHTKHQHQGLVLPLLRPSLLLPTRCPGRALPLHPPP